MIPRYEPVAAMLVHCCVSGLKWCTLLALATQGCPLASTVIP